MVNFLFFPQTPKLCSTLSLSQQTATCPSLLKGPLGNQTGLPEVQTDLVALSSPFPHILFFLVLFSLLCERKAVFA